MTTKKKISLAMGLLLASTALQAEEVVNRGIDVSVVTGGVAVPTGTALHGAERNVMFGDRGYQIPENVEVGSYYATWGIYDGRKYWPADVPVERLSEVYIAFAAICGSNPGANEGGASLEKFCQDSHDNTDVGSYYLPEIKSLDQGEVSFIDDPWGMFDMKDTSAEATAADTQIKQIIDWKNRNADLDVIMSVGGWSYSRPFFEMISTPVLPFSASALRAAPPQPLTLPFAKGVLRPPILVVSSKANMAITSPWSKNLLGKCTTGAGQSFPSI